MKHFLLSLNQLMYEMRIVGSAKFNDVYDEVIDYMLKHHEGQYRKFSKESYANHPARVAKTVEFYTKDEDLVIATLLHDILEDSEVTWPEMKERFGMKVAKLVQELTSHLPAHKKPKKTDYLIKKLLNITDDALIIKLSDRLDNVSDIMCPSCPEKSKDSVWEATKTIIKNLVQHRKLNMIHKKIILTIKEYLNGYKSIT
jgi:(p)ppGpp synthase/HD superfamily hydrolase